MPDGPVSRFDMNTLPLSPSWCARSRPTWRALPACSYPEATYWPLREAIAAYAGVARRRWCRAPAPTRSSCCPPSSRSGRGDMAVVAKPTYQLYAVATRTAGARLEAVEPRAGGLGLDLDAVAGPGPGRAAGLALLAQQPHRRGGPRERRERPVRRLSRASCSSTRPTSSSAARTWPASSSGTRTSSSRAPSPRAGASAAPLRLRAGCARRSPARSTPCGRRARSRSQSARAAELACARAADMRVDAAASGPSGTAWPPASRRSTSRSLAVPASTSPSAPRSTATRRSPGSPRAAGGAQLRPRAAARGRHPRLRRDAARERSARRPRGDAGARRPGRCPSRPPRRACGAGAAPPRAAPARRRSTCALDVDGTGRTSIATGIGFLDHMLPRARHPRPARPRAAAAAATSTSTSTTPSRTAASRWARRSTARSATAPASTASATPARRWTRRSRAASSTSAARRLPHRPRACPAQPVGGVAAASGRTCSTPWPARGRINLHLTSTARTTTTSSRRLQGSGPAPCAPPARATPAAAATCRPPRASCDDAVSCWSTTAPATCARCARPRAGRLRAWSSRTTPSRAPARGG